MRKKLAAVVAATALTGSTVLLSAGGASASPAVGGCPSGGDWFLVHDSDTIPGVDRGNFHDQNGDGHMCAKQHEDFSWTLKDNTNRL